MNTPDQIFNFALASAQRCLREQSTLCTPATDPVWRLRSIADMTLPIYVRADYAHAQATHAARIDSEHEYRQDHFLVVYEVEDDVVRIQVIYVNGYDDEVIVSSARYEQLERACQEAWDDRAAERITGRIAARAERRCELVREGVG